MLSHAFHMHSNLPMDETQQKGELRTRLAVLYSVLIHLLHVCALWTGFGGAVADGVGELCAVTQTSGRRLAVVGSRTAEVGPHPDPKVDAVPL